MNSFNDYKENGYLVEELLNKLKKLVEIGMGGRKVIIGPTDGDDGTKPIAQPVIGIEANVEGPESDICWLYPGFDCWE
jgi:hypothetical protein